ncbi:MAG: hypothetical protein M0Q44_02725 [Methylobacter sp.]|jgi:surface antigen|nr:hypothetical protein [Methylobacter sp.]
MMIQKIRKFCVCICIACLSLTSGCATNPTQSVHSSWTDCATGALLGGLLGAGIGLATGGGKGAAIGGAAGLVGGCATGYMISEYLKPEEKRQYDANLSKNMSNTPVNAGGSNVWQSPDGSKQVLTSFDKASSLNQAITMTGRPNATLNQNVLSRLPANPICRSASRKFLVNGTQAEEKGVSCRDANGDWVDVMSKTTA